MPVVLVDTLEKMCVGVLKDIGVNALVAGRVARHLIDAEAIGHRTHGLMLLPSLVRDVEEGRIWPNATPTIHEHGARLLCDLNMAFAQSALDEVVDRSVNVARRHGICVSFMKSVKNSGRLGAYVERIANAGLVGLIATGTVADQTDSAVAAFGGTKRSLGTNPIALAVPMPSESMVIDLATSVTTVGAVRLKRRIGGELPKGSIVDQNRSISSDPNSFYSGGALAPIGKHKGTALGIMIAVLSSLSGDFSVDGRLGGAVLWVADPSKLGYETEALRRAVWNAMRRIFEPEPRNGAGTEEEVKVPGSGFQAARRRAQEDGIHVPAEVLEDLDLRRSP